MPESYVTPPPSPAEPAEASYVRAAEGAAQTVYGYIDGGGISFDGALNAYAQLAVAASIDALRVALADRLEDVGTALADLRGAIDGLDL